MFSYANLTDLGDINQWDVTKVTDMYMMFAGSQIKNNHFTDWNISNVSKMDLMFMDTPVTVYYLWGGKRTIRRPSPTITCSWPHLRTGHIPPKTLSNR